MPEPNNKTVHSWVRLHWRTLLVVTFVSCIAAMALVASVVFIATGYSDNPAQDKSGRQGQQQQGGPQGGPGGGQGQSPGMMRQLGVDVDKEIAAALGISVEDLRKELQGGKTIAQLAKAKGISTDKLSETVTKKLSAALDKAYKEFKSNLSDMVKGFIEHSPPQGGQQGPPMMRRLGVDVGNEVAAALGISFEDLRKELQGGKTIAQLAQAKGITTDKLAETITQKLNEAVDKAVKEGKVTSQEATKIKSGLSNMAKNFIEHGPPPPPGGPGNGPPGEQGQQQGQQQGPEGQPPGQEQGPQGQQPQGSVPSAAPVQPGI